MLIMELPLHADPVITVLLSLIFILIIAKLGGFFAEKLQQPAVLGEIIAGIAIGNLFLLGFDFFEIFKDSEILRIFAELGVILLLFEVGIETKLKDMLAVGMNSLLVAIVGVFFPFLFGYIVSALMLPDLTEIQKIFFGAILTATSVGITARVFKDLNFTKTVESRIVLGAAVIDDVLGLIILAIVSGMVRDASLDLASAGWISFKAIAFLVIFVFLGTYLFRYIISFLAKQKFQGLMLTTALILCFIGSFLANQVGLASIVGAFATGLILVEEQFKHSDDDEYKIIDEIKPINIFFVPVFFVMTGMQVNLSVFSDSQVVLVALAITAVAMIGKVFAGWGFFSKEKIHRLIIGIGMIPRGEVGLIFASVGKSLGVVDDKVYAITVIVVVLTTLLPPIILSKLIKKYNVNHA